MPSVSGIANVRRVAHSLLSPGMLVTSVCLVVLFWFRALTIEPFDSFESIHRLAATEIKRSVDLVIGDHAYRAMVASASGAYTTLLAYLSTLLDGENSYVSAVSGRILSISLSIFILWTLHSTWKTLFNQNSYRSFEERRVYTTWFSPVFWTLLNAPILAASVLFLSDLLFLAFASAYICRQTVAMFSTLAADKQNWKSQVLTVCTLAGALATGGWSGFLLLALCPLLFSCLVWIYTRGWRRTQSQALSLRSRTVLFLRQSVTAMLLSFAFLFVVRKQSTIDLAGVDFRGFAHLHSLLSLEEVFAKAALIVVIGVFCYSLSIALLLYSYCIDSSVPDSDCEFPFSRPQPEDGSLQGKLVSLWFVSLVFVWLLSFLLLDGTLAALFFGCPVLSLWAVTLRTPQSFSSINKFRKYLTWLAHLLTFFLPTVLLLVAAGFLIQGHFDLNFLKFSPNTNFGSSVVSFFERAFYLGGSLFFAGVLSLVSSAVIFYWATMCLKRKRRSALFLSGTVRLVALIQTAVAVILLQGVVVEAEDIMTSSLQQAVDKAKLYMEPGESLATAALFAPNVVSYFGGSVEIRKDVAEELFRDRKYSVILTPDWNIGLCEKHGYDIAAGAEFYRLCLRSYKSTLEGPQN